ncbi:hypothetical protein Tco_1000523, partial [Tanacetum coccineum]
LEDDPKEDPEEELEVDAEEDVPPAATLPVGSPSTPPPVSKSSSNFEVAPIIATEIDANSYGIIKIGRRMDAFDKDLGHEVQFSNNVEHRVTMLDNSDQEKLAKMERCLDSLETSYTLEMRDQERLEREFYCMQVWVFERLGWVALEARPNDSIKVLAVY